MKPNLYLLCMIVAACSLAANAQTTERLSEQRWEKITGWHIGTGYTVAKNNSFNVDIGRYKTYKRSGGKKGCAFAMPPFVHRGIGIDYITNSINPSFAFRIYGQMEMLGVAGMRMDIVNTIEESRHSTQIRPSLGVSLAYFLDIYVNYTVGVINRSFLKDNVGISLRFNFNPSLNKQLYRAHTPNYKS